MILIILVLIIGFLFMVACLVSSWDTKTKDNYNISNNIIERFNIKYLGGGFPDIEGGHDGIIEFKDEGIFFIINNHKRYISRKTLIKAEIQSKQQISQEISLGKVLVFGILAWGMKDNKTTTENCLVITFQDNEQIRDIIISAIVLENISSTFQTYIKYS
ncbi:hypothetical protein [Clostridium sp.]|uniref:hypothetical protein n=1 Tax=Clostridium sp. TaxID=1506 RepID=UPI003D6D80CD